MLYHTTSSLTTRRCSSAWTALMLHRPSTDSHTSPLQFTCGSCRTSRRLSSLALLLSCQHHYTVDVARSTLPVSPQLKSLGVTGMNNWYWFDCHARNVANRPARLQLPHSRPAPRAQPAHRRRPDSRVQHRRFEARLLQCSAMRSTCNNIRQTAAHLDQPGQSRLPLPGSHRRQAAAPVAS